MICAESIRTEGINGINAIIMENFNTPMSSMDKSCNVKINKDISKLNWILDNHRKFHPKIIE